MLFFIAGITGHVGGSAARQLLAQGHTLRALVRDTNKAKSWADQGVELIQGDWNDTAALTTALQGVDGAYLMMSPVQTPSRDFREAKALVASYKQALSQAPPPKLVLLSSFGSDQTQDLGLITSTSLLEHALADLPYPVAAIRAGGFYENYLGGIPTAQATSALYSFYVPVERPVLMVGTADIGALVAKLLTTEWSGKRIIELGTPTAPSQIAAAMGQAIGKTVTAQPVPRDQWSGILQPFIPADYTWAFEQMCDSINSGHIHGGVPGTEAVPATLTPAEFFQQHKPAA